MIDEKIINNLFKPSKTPQKAHRATFSKNDTITLEGNKSSLKRTTECKSKLEREMEYNRLILERNKQAVKAYGENIQKSEQGRAEILKGLEHGVNSNILLLKAVEIIGSMTQDRTFTAQATRKIKERL